MRKITILLLFVASFCQGQTFLDFLEPQQINATSFSVSARSSTSLTFTWVDGNLTGRIVLMKASSAVNSDPVDGTTYTASTTFGSGTQIGTGNYVVNIGSGPVTVTGLTQNTDYYVAIYEYSGSGATIDYLTTSPATGTDLTFRTEYQNVLAQAVTNGDTQPTAQIQKAQNFYVDYLIDKGIYTKISAMWIMATGATNLTNFTRLNWITPASFRLTLMNSLVATELGYTGNGTNKYYKTGWIPSVDGGSLFVQNDASISTHRVESTTSAGLMFGTNNASFTKRTTFDGRFTGTIEVFEINTGTASTPAANDGSGFWQIKRTGSTASAEFRNGVSKATASTTSTGLSTVEVFGLCENNNGTPDFFSDKTAGCLIIASSLSTQESEDLQQGYAAMLAMVSPSYTFPDWKTNSTFSSFKSAFDTQSPYFLPTETFTTIGSAAFTTKYPSPLALYEGGLMSSYNNKIYYPPHSADAILEIDPSNSDAIRFIGTINVSNSGSSSLQYIGGWEDANTQILYFIPYSATKILWYNPITDAYGFVPSGNGPSLSATKKYAGGCKTLNNKGVGIPHNSGNVLLVTFGATPSETTWEVFGTISGADQYVSGAVIEDGKIVCAPYSATQVGLIDPVAKTFTLVGTVYAGTTKWGGTFYIPKTKQVYITPFTDTRILKYDPVAQTTSTFTTGLSGSFESGAILDNGNLLMIPLGATGIGFVDTNVDACRLIPGTVAGGGTNKYVGAVHHINGSYYCPPFDLGNVLKVFPRASDRAPASINLVKSIFYDHY